MPVPTRGDPERARRDLAGWIAHEVPGATSVEVTALETPRNTGYANETLMFDAAWTVAGRRESKALVARVRPAGYSIFPDDNLDAQRRILEILHGRTDIPVPEVFWHRGDDGGPLGRPFFVMGRIDGHAPPDHPPYAAEGWLVEASPDDQRKLYTRSLRQLAAIHALDWEQLGLHFLDRSGNGAPGLAEQLAYWEGFVEWMADDRSFPLLSEALVWLGAHAPVDTAVRVNWGDARIGNILFRDFTPVAILDWEMASLGPPEADLAWWLVFHRTWTEGLGLPDLPGFPDAEETVALYEDMTGSDVADLHYYEVWAAFRLSVVLHRLDDMLVGSGVLPPGSRDAPSLPATRILTSLLER